MASVNPEPAMPPDLGDLPLGLLLGRLSGALREALLNGTDMAVGDVRLVGLALSIEGNGQATQADHARYLGIDLNTASRLVNRAEKDGLVARVPSPADRRAFTLTLTPDGQALAASGRAALDRTQAGLATIISPADLARFRKTAEALLAALDP